MKQIKVFQIKHNNDKQTHYRLFSSLRTLKAMKLDFDFSYYTEIFNGQMNVTNAEDVYMQLQGTKPNGYNGHTLSVSDIVEMDGKMLFCDSFGFTDITDKIKGAQG